MNFPYASAVTGERIVKILVLSPQSRRLAEVEALLAEHDRKRDSVLAEGQMGDLMTLMERELPELVILESPELDDAAFEALERVQMRFAGVAIAIACPTPPAEALLRLMRLGIREVVPSPLSAEAFGELIGRLNRTGTPAGRSGSSHGKAIAFIPCKGGSGATFLAANLAYAIASQENKRVALIDLNLQFGDAALFVSDAVPRSTLADVVRDITRLDATFLRSSMVEITPQFSVLAAPEEVDQATSVKPDHIDRLLDVALASFDYVVLDTGRRLDGVTIRALDRVDAIYPVLQMTLPFLRDAKRLLNAFHSLGYGADKVHLIANRYEKGGEITLQSVAKTLGHAVETTVPNSFENVAASVNQGIPIIKLSARDPVARCLQDLARTMVQGKQEQGWLKSVLKLG